jgi:glutamyl-tRNA reductase
VIVVVGLSHRTAPLHVRERLAVPRDALPELLSRLTSLGPVGEAVVLSTCNRVEVYASVRDPRPQRAPGGPAASRSPAPGSSAGDAADLEETSRAVCGVLTTIGTEAVLPHLACTHGAAAVRHLFRVAASLDSLVVGEPQILGQLKDAIEIARETKALGPMLGKAMHRAVHVGKRVRTETAIGAGQVSISSVAIDLARQIFGDLTGHTALLVGAGEMAEAASRIVVKEGARLIVVNRSVERAEALAREVGGEPRGWQDLERSLVDADIVISSTSSPRPILTRDLVKAASKARKGRSLFLIDIAVPRDVDPAVNKLDNVYLYDIDDLSQIVAESLEGRAVEAARAETIVGEEARGFELWALERLLTPTIVGLRARTRSILAAELERSLSGKLKHLAVAEREALTLMIDAATNKLLHVPVTRLKSMAADPRAGDYLDAVCDLFELTETEGQQLPNEPERPAQARASERPAQARASEHPAQARESEHPAQARNIG